MIKGTLKFFSTAKGFGFITPDGEGKDVFLPATTIAAAGAIKLQAGQRVSFEQEADVKGPKAVNLQLLDEKPRPPAAPPVNTVLYYDPDCEESDDVLAALQACARSPRLVDYASAPPDREELKRLSLVLRDAEQSLVRRYDALFLDLQLDDRFIAENEFWTAIHEHPTLINGPVLVEGAKARIVKNAADVRAFLGMADPADGKKTKEISPRMAAMMQALSAPAARAPILAPTPSREAPSREREPALAAASDTPSGLSPAPVQPRVLVPIRERTPEQTAHLKAALAPKPAPVVEAPPKPAAPVIAKKPVAKPAPKAAPAKKPVAKKPAPKKPVPKPAAKKAKPAPKKKKK